MNTDQSNYLLYTRNIEVIVSYKYVIFLRHNNFTRNKDKQASKPQYQRQQPRQNSGDFQ